MLSLTVQMRSSNFFTARRYGRNLCRHFTNFSMKASPMPSPSRVRSAATFVHRASVLTGSVFVFVFVFFSAPESERKPPSTLISQVFVYRFEPGSFLPPLSGLSVAVIKVWFTPSAVLLVVTLVAVITKTKLGGAVLGPPFPADSADQRHP